VRRNIFYFLLATISVVLSGCQHQQTIPKGALSLAADTLEKRQYQSRYFESSDSNLLLSASSAVLQDLGFTIDDSESELGFLVASKERDATEAGQVAAAIILVVLTAALGAHSEEMAIDKNQKIRVAVIVSPSLDGGRTYVRTKFQRIVWNTRNQISRLETITEKTIYQEFFDKLSKSVFLEANKI